MTASQQKRRPLSRYLKDFKHSQCDCSHCGKSLDRMSLVFRGKILDRETLAGMDQLIDDRVWQELEKELTALCRFCSDVYCHCTADYFDILEFKQYLFEQTEMSHSSIREYIVRLRRLDDMLRASDFPDEKFCGSEQQWDLIENMTDANQNNYRIALRKYDQYLSWQKTAVC